MKFSPAQSEQLEKSLSRNIAGDVHWGSYSRAHYSTDASLYQIQPLGVVVPKTPEDTRCAMQIAAECGGAPIVPRGAGTSLSGQSIGSGLVIDFSKYMNQILDLDPRQSVARVQPGVVLDQLNGAAAPHGLQFGPDVATSSRANLGGMIGNNSAGAHSIRNGKTVDHVIELDVLLAGGAPLRLGPLTQPQLEAKQRENAAEGRIYREVSRIIDENREEVLARYPHLLRRVSGYNLDEFLPECRSWYEPPRNVRRVRETESRRYPAADFNLSKLVVGAEGTLAAVTEALVHLTPLPRERGLAALHFESLDESCAALSAILSCDPSAVEFLDKLILELAAGSLEYKNYLDFVVGQPESLIIVEFDGDAPDEIRSKIDDLKDKLRGQSGLYHTLVAMEPQLCDHVWACRKAALPLLMGIPGTRKPVAFVEDTAVDPPRLPEFVRRFREILHQNDTDGAFYGHASVGCMHIRPLIDAANAEDLARLQRISSEVCDLVLEFEGAMSGEHGDGLARSYLNEKLFGPKLYQAFRQIKAAFDPENRMNPGKIVDAQSPVENLRLGGQQYKTLNVQTALDFSKQGGFAQAVELCNGSALCRKTQTGTMCPSFMATGDEEHSTRGRANALRLVLSGALPPEELTGERLYQTFDLCLQCKGCKSECPSNVDVAKMKVEFLGQYYKKHGTPLAVRLMGNVARLNRAGAALAPMSNWFASIPGMGWLQEKLLGVDRRRPLPTFHRRHFAKWFRRRAAANRAGGADANAPRGKIVLLDDCLTSYCEPGVNRAAVQVLEAAGYEVHLAGLLCCGRAMLSKGLVNEAKQLAENNIAQLLPWAQQGVPIVGCEPSCILTLADDYLDLVPGDASKTVAQHAQLIDTVLVQAGVEFEALKQTAADPKRLLLHGHCHQKALVGVGDTCRLLEQVPGVAVETLDSGCCGMAGSFGYEHYDLSMKIGERVLFPAVRNNPGAEIIAPGFSCRHQIQHGAGKTAQHPIEFLARHVTR